MPCSLALVDPYKVCTSIRANEVSILKVKRSIRYHGRYIYACRVWYG